MYNFTLFIYLSAPNTSVAMGNKPCKLSGNLTRDKEKLKNICGRYACHEKRINKNAGRMFVDSLKGQFGGGNQAGGTGKMLSCINALNKRYGVERNFPKVCDDSMGMLFWFKGMDGKDEYCDNKYGIKILSTYPLYPSYEVYHQNYINEIALSLLAIPIIILLLCLCCIIGFIVGTVSNYVMTKKSQYKATDLDYGNRTPV
eukprot:523343_1